MADKPITDEERVQLKLILGGAVDSVARSRAWCAEHGGKVVQEAGRFYARRDGETLATALDLGTLCDKLERLES